MKLKFALARLLTLTMFLTLIPPTPAHTDTMQDYKENIDVKAENDLRFRLSEGTHQVERPTPNPVAPAALLSEAESNKLLARLPAITQDASETLDFRLREGSQPPPHAGETIQAAFAPPATNDPPTPTKTTAPLEVSRFAPEGEVALAPTLSVTFSQPMVAVASQEEAATIVPVTLTPQPKGKWRWLGTQTLIFQPEGEGGRLPMATDYTVTIPAGTRSALGNSLSEARTFTFATPPPTLIRSYPNNDSQPRDVLMFLEFDQRIEPTQVLERIKFQSANNTRLRLATSAEIAADTSTNNCIKQAQEGRWLVFRAIDSNNRTKDALPSDTNIKVVILPGAPSAEGTRTTTKEQSFDFNTYGALRVTGTRCGYEKRCSPFDSFNVTFSNQIDSESFQSSQVKITPDIPDAKISASYNSISIQGAKRSNTTYTVTLDRAIKDTFNQTLTGTTRLTFKVTTADPSLFTTGEGFVVLDPAGKRAFAVYSVNYARLKVALYKVTPADWQQFRRYQGARDIRAASITPPGMLVSDEVINVKAATDELVETQIDLLPALTNGFGQVYVRVEPVEGARVGNKPVTVDAYRQNKVEAWVQSTEIGLDAFADKRQLIA